MDPVSEIAERGYTVLADVFDADRAAALVADLTRLEQELGTVPATNSFEGTRTLRVYNLLAHGPLWQELAVDPAVLPVVEGVLDDGCLLSSLSSIRIQPGEVAQPVHADDQVIPLAKPHVPTVCNTLWALTDFTEANGATRVIAGSHLRDHDPDYGAPYDTEPAEMPAGSVLFYTGALYHGGGANRSDATRLGVNLTYAVSWLRQEENQYLSVPAEIARTLPEPLLRLMGYARGAYALGYVDDLRDPLEVLLGRPTGEAFGDLASAARRATGRS